MPYKACGKLEIARNVDQPLAMKISEGPKLFGRDIPAGAYFVDIHIAGKAVSCLVDTGACVTVMSECLFRSLPNLELKSPPESMQVFEGVVQGSQLKAKGVVYTPIEIANFTSGPHPVVVAPSTRMECILGLDFLDKYSISVDTANRQLRICSSGKETVCVDVKP